MFSYDKIIRFRRAFDAQVELSKNLGCGLKINSKYIGALCAISASLSSVAIAQIAGEAAQNEVAATPTKAPPTAEEISARAILVEGTASNAAGNLPAAVASWSRAYTSAPQTDGGIRIAMEAAKRLGFAAIENRNTRQAESYWAAEAVLARKLYFSGAINARGFAESIGHWASGAGAMGRSNESSALIFYAAEVKARAQAAQSSQIMNREANFTADKVESIRVNVGDLCVTEVIEILKTHVTCEDEQAAKSEAMSLQARQITADAPPPPTKAEREAKAAKDKKGGGE